MEKIMLSPSALNLFEDCPRCFWLEKREKIRRPRGIFPSLPGGMDLVIKAYFDGYRAKGALPPELKGRVRGQLFEDAELIEVWRNWKRTDLRHDDKSLDAVLSGALDDCLVDDGLYIPLDYKTRGFELKEDSTGYYQTQLDCYCLMLESSGFGTAGIAYLVYYWPEEVSENGMVRFNVRTIEMKTDSAAAKRLFEEAVHLLRLDIPPQPSAECEYCGHIEQRKARGQRGQGQTFTLY
jgi:hypothetical protein